MIAFSCVQILAEGQQIAVPVSTEWMPTLLLTILWIFVAAAVAGAIMRFFGKGGRRAS
jgi:hypothetical protein